MIKPLDTRTDARTENRRGTGRKDNYELAKAVSKLCNIFRDIFHRPCRRDFSGHRDPRSMGEVSRCFGQSSKNPKRVSPGESVKQLTETEIGSDDQGSERLNFCEARLK
jgi:hypothetical protein